MCQVQGWALMRGVKKRTKLFIIEVTHSSVLQTHLSSSTCQAVSVGPTKSRYRSSLFNAVSATTRAALRRTYAGVCKHMA